MSRGIEGLERLRKRFDAMPKKAREAAANMVRKSAQEMEAQMVAIAPKEDANTGDQNLAEHIYWEEGRLGDVSAVVIADAKDAKGRPKAARVELGHMAPNGIQVPAEPFFYPVVRTNSARIKRRIARAVGRALKS